MLTQEKTASFPPFCLTAQKPLFCEPLANTVITPRNPVAKWRERRCRPPCHRRVAGEEALEEERPRQDRWGLPGVLLEAPGGEGLAAGSSEADGGWARRVRSTGRAATLPGITPAGPARSYARLQPAEVKYRTPNLARICARQYLTPTPTLPYPLPRLSESEERWSGLYKRR